MPPCSSPGNTSSGRHQVFHTKLLATRKRNLLSTEMIPRRAEWKSLIYYSASFLMWWRPELSSSPLLSPVSSAFRSPIKAPSPSPFLSPSPLLFSVPSPHPSSFPFCVRPHISTSVSVPVPAPSPLPSPFPLCVCSLASIPVTVRVPVSDPDPVRSLPSHGRCYPVGPVNLYRHRTVRAELSGARKRHSLSAAMMMHAE